MKSRWFLVCVDIICEFMCSAVWKTWSNNIVETPFKRVIQLVQITVVIQFAYDYRYTWFIETKSNVKCHSDLNIAPALFGSDRLIDSAEMLFFNFVNLSIYGLEISSFVELESPIVRLPSLKSGPEWILFTIPKIRLVDLINQEVV